MIHKLFSDADSYIKVPKPIGRELVKLSKLGLYETEFILLMANGEITDISGVMSKTNNEMIFGCNLKVWDGLWNMVLGI